MTIRLDTKAQLERYRRAAGLRKWSLNRFVLEALDKVSAETLATEKCDPLMAEIDRQPLNQ